MPRIALIALMLFIQHATARAQPADVPVERTDANSRLAHQQLLAKTKQGRIDVYFVGDSITRRWGATDYPDFLAHWNDTFRGWNAANFAWGGDNTRNILWRLKNGELDGVQPRVFVILAGTNNFGRQPRPDDAENVSAGIRAIVQVCREHSPAAKIVLMGIFPRHDNPALADTIADVNARLEKLAADSGGAVRFLSINSQLSGEDGKLKPEVSVDGLHLTLEGYRIWGDALKPVLTDLLGPPAAADHAPPPTGDPSANRQVVPTP